MIEAGVSVVAALVTLEDQTDDKYLKEVVSEVRADVESGMIFSRALARHPKVFDRLFVAMVAAGESSGTLDIVLDRVATQIEKATKLKRRVKSAMIYPAVVISFATLVLIFMLMFIVPVFQKVFDELNGQLPTPTRIIIGMSNALRGYWFIIFPMVGLIIYLLRRLKRSEEGTKAWDRFKLRLPMKIGDVVQKVALARISRTLATLVAAGVDIISALDIAAGTAGNWVLESALNRTSTRVGEGVPISVPLMEDDIFPPMVSQMVKIGEETGELDKMLGKIADFYEDEVDSSIAALTSIIEPLLMICVGAMVGTIVISRYLPMFKLLTLIK
jgi:type IV pilus assembly protein PilC